VRTSERSRNGTMKEKMLKLKPCFNNKRKCPKFILQKPIAHKATMSKQSQTLRGNKNIEREEALHRRTRETRTEAA